MRVLDPTEVSFDFGEAAMFHDVESGRDLYIDPDAARESYLMHFREHADAIRTICNNLGIDFHEITIDQPLELILFDFLTDRLKRGRPSVRGGAR
jgi:hypothetical protein